MNKKKKFLNLSKCDLQQIIGGAVVVDKFNPLVATNTNIITDFAFSTREYTQIEDALRNNDPKFSFSETKAIFDIRLKDNDFGGAIPQGSTMEQKDGKVIIKNNTGGVVTTFENLGEAKKYIAESMKNGYEVGEQSCKNLVNQIIDNQHRWNIINIALSSIFLVMQTGFGIKARIAQRHDVIVRSLTEKQHLAYREKNKVHDMALVDCIDIAKQWSFAAIKPALFDKAKEAGIAYSTVNEVAQELLKIKRESEKIGAVSLGGTESQEGRRLLAIQDATSENRDAADIMAIEKNLQTEFGEGARYALEKRNNRITGVMDLVPTTGLSAIICAMNAYFLYLGINGLLNTEEKRQ